MGLTIAIYLISLAGLFVSLYAYIIEQKIKKNPSYKPACDISDKFSCTKPIISTYGKMFGISNSLLGMSCYAVFFIAALLNLTYILFVLALTALVGTFYFAWVLYFKIKSFCLVCITTYIINIALFILAYLNLR